MEVAIRQTLATNEAITVFELAGQLSLSRADAASQALETVKSAGLDCKLFFVGSGRSKKSGEPATTIPGPLAEVQTKVDNQFEDGATVSLYCVGPNKEGAPRIAKRRYRSLSAPGLAERTYKTLSRSESDKTFKARAEAFAARTPTTPALSTASFGELKGMSQLTLNSTTSSGQLGRQQSAQSVASPTSAPLQKAASSTGNSTALKVKPEPAAQSAPLPTAKPAAVVFDVDKENTAAKPVVKPASTPAPVAAVVNLVEDSPIKPRPVVAVDQQPKQIEEPDNEKKDECVEGDEVPPPAPAPPAAATPVKVTEEKAAVSAPQPAAEEKVVLPVVTSLPEAQEGDEMPKTAEVPPPPPPPAQKKPNALSMLMTNAKKGAPAKAAAKSKSTAKPKSTTAKPKTAAKENVAKEQSKSDEAQESESEDEEAKEKAEELRRYREEQAAPAVLSVANDELELCTLMPLAPVQPPVQPVKKDEVPSAGAKRTRETMEKEGKSDDGSAAATTPALPVPTHKNILNFFRPDRANFSKQWTKKTDRKTEKINGAWHVSDVDVYVHKETGETIDSDEYKRRDAAFIASANNTEAVPVAPATAGGLPDGTSPGAALRNDSARRSVSQSLGAAGAGDDKENAANDEPPAKKARKEAPAAKPRVNKKEAPAGQRPITSFFQKKN